jgi:hypothetical protein
MLKLCQLVASLAVVCVTVSVLPLWLMLPVPPTMLPPVGKTLAVWANAAGERAHAKASVTAGARDELLLVLPTEDTISDTTTNC